MNSIEFIEDIYDMVRSIRQSDRRFTLVTNDGRKTFINKNSSEKYVIIQCWQLHKRIDILNLNLLFDEYETKFPRICDSQRHLKLFFKPSLFDFRRIIAFRV